MVNRKVNNLNVSLAREALHVCINKYLSYVNLEQSQWTITMRTRTANIVNVLSS